jgi:hypothetical protein
MDDVKAAARKMGISKDISSFYILSHGTNNGTP